MPAKISNGLFLAKGLVELEPDPKSIFDEGALASADGTFNVAALSDLLSGNLFYPFYTIPASTVVDKILLRKIYCHVMNIGDQRKEKLSCFSTIQLSRRKTLLDFRLARWDLLQCFQQL